MLELVKIRKLNTLEIKEIANQMLNLIKQIDSEPFKYTINAWGL